MSPIAVPYVATPQERFVEERKYLKNVSLTTLVWYQEAFKTFNGCQSEADYKARIVALRQRGLSPVSVNSWLRCINAFLKWSQAGYKLPKLQEDRRILATLSAEQVRLLLADKAKQGLNARRIQTLAAVLLDTGLRVAEALSLRWQDVDLDNLLVCVMGKGRKERRVPISLEGRKWLFLWKRQAGNSGIVFSTSTRTALSVRNSQRDLSEFCESVGIRGVRCSPHTLRHTFAVSYLRAGGNLEYLRRILGHSSIQITQRYLQSLTPEDLGRVHNSLSPLVTS